jgi:hypothetical protein
MSDRFETNERSGALLLLPICLPTAAPLSYECSQVGVISDGTFRPPRQLSVYSFSDRIDFRFVERSLHGRRQSAAPSRYIQSESNATKFCRDDGRDLSGYEGRFAGVRNIPKALPHTRRTTETV